MLQNSWKDSLESTWATMVPFMLVMSLEKRVQWSSLRRSFYRFVALIRLCALIVFPPRLIGIIKTLNLPFKYRDKELLKIRVKSK